LDTIAASLDVAATWLQAGGKEAERKARFARELGATGVATIGNGANDVATLGAAGLGIAVLGPLVHRGELSVS
jgi:soluble P-type ATPase